MTKRTLDIRNVGKH